MEEPKQTVTSDNAQTGAFAMRTLLMWLGLVLGLGIVLVLVTTNFLSELARQRALKAIVAEADRDLSGPELTAAPASRSADDPLRFAVAPVVSPETSLLLYGDLVDYIAQRVGRTGQLLLQEDYAQTNQLLEAGACDVAMICTYAYIVARRKAGVEALAVPQIDGKVTYQSVLVVGAPSPYQRLADLAGKRFASADTLSTTGWLFPAVALLADGLDPDSFFGEHLLVGSHDRALAAVAAGDADGAAVHSLVFENAAPDVRARLRVIDRSSPYGMPPIVVPATTPRRLREAILDALLSAHRDPEGRKVLKALNFQRFVLPSRTHYDTVEELVESWESR
jgi:phosphonate transport system substrate-binding protein